MKLLLLTVSAIAVFNVDSRGLAGESRGRKSDNLSPGPDSPNLHHKLKKIHLDGRNVNQTVELKKTPLVVSYGYQDQKLSEATQQMEKGHLNMSNIQKSAVEDRKLPSKRFLQGCGGEDNGVIPSGLFGYPRYGHGNYKNNENCSWIIRSKAPIEIEFMFKFDIEQGYDYLYVRDGDNSGSNLIGKFTGSSFPDTVQTTTNAAYLHFTSDYSITGLGFEIIWSPIGCFRDYNSNYGMIQYPVNGGNYLNKEGCVWNIRATLPIKITFIRFNIEQGYDKLKISDGANLLGIFTGTTLPNAVQTTTNAARLYFTSDYSVTKPGFEIFWEPLDRCVCGKVNRVEKIVNGTITEENEYPWQVALVGEGSTRVYCGGSLINDRWVLTAAHCTRRGVAQIILGNHLISATDSAEMRVNITTVVNHPNYTSTINGYDFALLELATPLDLEAVAPHIRPVCLPSANNPSQYEDVDVIVTGWGRLSAGGGGPNALQEVTVRTMSNSECNSEKYQYDGEILESMICAASPGKDSCQGDSGGPMVRDVGGYFNLIGVTSWGRGGCAHTDFPGVYGRVTYELDWITSISSSGNTCAPPN